MVVPVKIKHEEGKEPIISYVLVEQYRHGCGDVCLEFPAGRCDKGEDFETAARRELLEETGYKVKSIKFLHTQWLSPVRSADKQNVYVAVVEDEPESTQHEPSEVGSGMTVVEMSAEQLHLAVRDNSIGSVSTLASLCSVLLSSTAALKYLDSTPTQESI